MLNQKTFFSRNLLGCAALALCLTSQAWAQSTSQSEWRIQALHAEAGKPSVYEIVFTAREALTPEAEFALEFPEEFDLSQLQIAGSPDMSGGFTLLRDKQKALVKRSGLGQTVASGARVRLRLGAIINPKNFESNAAVAMQVRASAKSTATTFARQRVAFLAADKLE